MGRSVARCRGKARSSPRPECPGLPHRVSLLAFPSNQPSEHYSEIHLNKHSLEYANEAEADLTGSEIPMERKQKKKSILSSISFQSHFQSFKVAINPALDCYNEALPAARTSAISSCQELPLTACSMESPSVCRLTPPRGVAPHPHPLTAWGARGGFVSEGLQNTPL